eukprot:9491199-Pyramimonas_sp.AAC.1
MLHRRRNRCLPTTRAHLLLVAVLLKLSNIDLLRERDITALPGLGLAQDLEPRPAGDVGSEE